MTATVTPKKQPEKAPKMNEWRPVFLANLRETGNVRDAALAAGISRKTAYASRERNASFRAEWVEVMEEAIDELEVEARKRAKSTSDVLLIFLLKSHRPSVYRERHEFSGPGGGPIDVTTRATYDLRDNPEASDLALSFALVAGAARAGDAGEPGAGANAE